jgi:hypothetical protein
MRDIAKMCVAGFIGAAVAMSMGAKPSSVHEELYSKAFVLVDNSGKVTGTLATVEGEPTLLLRHGDSGALKVCIKNNGGEIVMGDKLGKNVVQITADSDACETILMSETSSVQLKSERKGGIVSTGHGAKTESVMFASENGCVVRCVGEAGTATLKPEKK